MTLSALALAEFLSTNLAAMTPAKVAAVPVAIALVAGTAAAATYAIPTSSPATTPSSTATAPTSTATAAATPSEAAKPCEAQTWPYIERRCLGAAKDAPQVRVVMAPRASDPVDYAKPTADLAPTLTTRDGVLRGPAPQIDPASAPKPAKRQSRGSRYAAQPYQVPVERRARRETKPVIVVRPLRLDAYSSF